MAWYSQAGYQDILEVTYSFCLIDFQAIHLGSVLFSCYYNQPSLSCILDFLLSLAYISTTDHNNETNV
jgi:hypothetical protein